MQGLAETLLTLDMPGRICGPDMKPGQRVKLSPLGCAMLATLLSFPQVISAVSCVSVCGELQLQGGSRGINNRAHARLRGVEVL